MAVLELTLPVTSMSHSSAARQKSQLESVVRRVLVLVLSRQELELQGVVRVPCYAKTEDTVRHRKDLPLLVRVPLPHIHANQRGLGNEGALLAAPCI